MRRWCAAGRAVEPAISGAVLFGNVPDAQTGSVLSAATTSLVISPRGHRAACLTSLDEGFGVELGLKETDGVVVPVLFDRADGLASVLEVPADERCHRELVSSLEHDLGESQCASLDCDVPQFARRAALVSPDAGSSAQSRAVGRAPTCRSERSEWFPDVAQYACLRARHSGKSATAERCGAVGPGYWPCTNVESPGGRCPGRLGACSTDPLPAPTCFRPALGLTTQVVQRAADHRRWRACVGVHPVGCISRSGAPRCRLRRVGPRSAARSAWSSALHEFSAARAIPGSAQAVIAAIAVAQAAVRNAAMAVLFGWRWNVVCIGSVSSMVGLGGRLRPLSDRRCESEAAVALP